MTSSSLFNDVPCTPPDAIFELTALYRADSAPHKVNLGQGTYRDSEGHPWILPAVQAAKARLQDADHEYLPILGLPAFRTLASALVLGDESSAVRAKRVASCQALAGTGALHLAGKLLHQTLGAANPVYITTPSWSNHQQVFESVGLHVREFRNTSTTDGRLDLPAVLAALREAPPRSSFVFHASAHNPTGWDPSPEAWREIGLLVQQRQLVPVFDAAYLGLTSGDYARDCFPIRHFVDDLALEVMVCLSFAKSMGIYGERVGLCAVVTRTSTVAAAVESALAQLIRAEISNPPAFGARVVTAVLADDALRAEWARNLVTMHSRLVDMRCRLAAALQRRGTPGNWTRIIEQKGMFTILGLTSAQVRRLQGNVEYVAECIDRVVRG
ncbi:putative aspartate aminotransferase [Aspergillus ibericus CBS 121593]|uniref:Aspartate aminotransferase n=1 Tax=Aspergillus ibericus CBS 121593 TaxID=1448316 RepID=A0A395H423_9EURO|nr:putative aspartate aminotransferase [Aspergillus ibericus CBS 121593]RAL02671.1 putative aspartate aminotransferase [Aspergillus ibericus CBS 121593]